MSDHWEQFPCTMGEHAAFISYDHGVRAEIDDLPFPYFVSFRVDLDNPDDRGLPQGDEFSKLNELEDFLGSKISMGEGIQVGRITTKGKRYFHFYTALSDTSCNSIAQHATEWRGYSVDVLHEEDGKRSHYWNELFPTDDDWRVIQDIRVEEALRNHGDSLQQTREIDHWVYFKSATQRDAFLKSVASRFRDIRVFESPTSEERRFGTQLKHIGLPDYRSMNSITLLLYRAARENGGEYDGWEAPVCKQ